MTNRQLLCELGHEDYIIFENPDYDSAIIGVSDDNKVVYDFDQMVQHLMDNEHMTEEEATDFIYYNTIRSLPYAGEGAPIVMYRLNYFKGE